MDKRIEELLESISKLENELYQEIQKKEAEFYYKISGQKVRFAQEIKKQHRAVRQKIARYFREAQLLNILTAPVIWFILLPACFLDAAVTIFQLLCFPVYGIPRVRRHKYFIIDRHALSYLNLIEKLNCIYCGYFNGLIGYTREIAARTEQYWCPIKHARRVASIHSRYAKFFEYGDSASYRRHLETVRRDFRDLEEGGKE